MAPDEAYQASRSEPVQGLTAESKPPLQHFDDAWISLQDLPQVAGQVRILEQTWRDSAYSALWPELRHTPKTEEAASVSEASKRVARPHGDAFPPLPLYPGSRIEGGRSGPDPGSTSFKAAA